MSKKPLLVLISDVHYNINTLPLADAAMRTAIKKANELKVPFVVAGDLHDTKANLRAECIDAIKKTLSHTSAIILVGNHDLVNEKSDQNALGFIDDNKHIIVSKPVELRGVTYLPYYSDNQKLLKALEDIPHGSTIVCHQGVESAHMGDYVQDKTSLCKDAFANYRALSGHYHTAQDIKCGPPKKGNVGTFTYIGNPYTLTFGEANDPVKGFVILYSDGSIERIPTNLRKHIIVERTIDNCDEPDFNVNSHDLLWLKIRGPKAELAKLNKIDLGAAHIGHGNYKLDLIPTDEDKRDTSSDEKLTQFQLLDKIIEEQADDKEQEERLRKFWREVL